MQLATLAPSGKSIVIGGLLLAALAFAPRSHEVTHRLALHAPVQPHAFYLSAFIDGDVTLTFPDDELVPVTFRMRAEMTDGCRWEGLEKLTPLDEHTFAYDYSETILSCEPGADPALKTPRSGLVSVDD